MNTNQTLPPFQRSLAFAHLCLTAALAFAVVEFAIFVPAVVNEGVVRVGKTATKIDAMIADTQDKIDATYTDTHKVLLTTGLAMDHVREMAATEEVYLAKIDGVTIKTVELANGVIKNLDSAVTEAGKTVSKVSAETLPAVDRAVDSATSVVNAAKGVIARADTAVDGLAQVERDSSAILGDAHVILSDPAIREIAPRAVVIETNVGRATGYIADDLAPNGSNVWHRIWQVFFPGKTKRTK